MTGDGFDIINLILLIVAVVVLWRLRSVLGRRTGHERPPYDPYSRREQSSPPSDAAGSEKGSDNVVSLPGATPRPDAADRAGAASAFTQDASVAQSLTEITLADRNFDPSGFVQGARAAHEMIVTAFAQGNRADLKPLLTKDVYAGFEGAISEREANNQTVELHYIGLNSADIVGASLEGRRARVTVKFVSEQTTCTKNPDGVVVAGDPVTVRTITDVWTFERDVKSSDPNWELAATGAED